MLLICIDSICNFTNPQNRQLVLRIADRPRRKAQVSVKATGHCFTHYRRRMGRVMRAIYSYLKSTSLCQLKHPATPPLSQHLQRNVDNYTNGVSLQQFARDKSIMYLQWECLNKAAFAQMNMYRPVQWVWNVVFDRLQVTPVMFIRSLLVFMKQIYEFFLYYSLVSFRILCTKA